MISSQSVGGKPPDAGDRSNRDRGSNFGHDSVSGATQGTGGPSVSRVDSRDYKVSRHDTRDPSSYGSMPSWRRNSRPQEVSRRDDRVSKDHWKERRRFPVPPRKDFFRENYREKYRDFRDSRDSRGVRDFRDSRDLRELKDIRGFRNSVEDTRSRQNYEESLKEGRKDEPKTNDRLGAEHSPSERFPDRRDDRKISVLVRPEARFVHSENNNEADGEFKGPKKFLKRPGDKFKDLLSGAHKSYKSENTKELSPTSPSSTNLLSSFSGSNSLSTADSVNLLGINQNLTVVSPIKSEARTSAITTPGNEKTSNINPTILMESEGVLENTTKPVEQHKDHHEAQYLLNSKNPHDTHEHQEPKESAEVKKPLTSEEVEDSGVHKDHKELIEIKHDKIDGNKKRSEPSLDFKEQDSPEPQTNTHSGEAFSDTELAEDAHAFELADSKTVQENVNFEFIIPAESNDALKSTKSSENEVADVKSLIKETPQIPSNSMDVDNIDYEPEMLPQELKIHKFLAVSIAEIKKVVSPGHFKPKIWQIDDPNQNTIDEVSSRVLEVMRTINERREYYEARSKKWITLTEKLDRESENREKHQEKEEVSASERSQSHTSTGNVRKRSRDENTTVSNGNGQTQTTASRNPKRSRERHSRVHGDVARSEAEFLEILANLEAETARDPLVRARLTSAKIPSQAQVTDESRFSSTNELIVDHSVLLKRLQTDAIDNFTADEHNRFLEAYLKYPKEFGKIANEVGRNFNECVAHYYRTKKAVGYKSILLQKSKRKRGRKPRKKLEEVTPVSTTTNAKSLDDDVLPNGTPQNLEKATSVNSEEQHDSSTSLIQQVPSVPEQEECLPPPVQPIEKADVADNVKVIHSRDEWSAQDSAAFSKLLATYGLQFDKIALVMGKAIQEVKVYFDQHQGEYHSPQSFPQLSNSLGFVESGPHQIVNGPPTGVFLPIQKYSVIPPVVEPVMVESNGVHEDGIHSRDSTQTLGSLKNAVDPDETTLEHSEILSIKSPPVQQPSNRHFTPYGSDINNSVQRYTNASVIPFYLPPVSLVAPIRPILPIKPSSHKEIVNGDSGSLALYSFETSGFNISNERRN